MVVPQSRPSSLQLLSQQGGPRSIQYVSLVGKMKAPGRFCFYNEDVLEWEGENSSHLLLRLAENHFT